VQAVLDRSISVDLSRVRNYVSNLYPLFRHRFRPVLSSFFLSSFLFPLSRVDVSSTANSGSAFRWNSV
jgi:hypothetical protein